MSHCGGCNITPDLFKKFTQTLKIQPTQIIQKNASFKPNQALDWEGSKPKQILTGESQFTNNGKFLKFIRK